NEPGEQSADHPCVHQPAGEVGLVGWHRRGDGYDCRFGSESCRRCGFGTSRSSGCSARGKRASTGCSSVTGRSRLKMTGKKRIATIVLFACAAWLAPGTKRLLADQNDRTHQIGAKIKCICGGCDQAAGKCYHVGGQYSGPCNTAKTMLKEIDA